MTVFDNVVQHFYGAGKRHFFDPLYQQVNRQALAPFFQPWLRPKGRVLEAGSGSGHLAGELGLKNCCFLDLTWAQIKRFQDTGTPGFFIHGDLQQLPFEANTFEQVICSNVVHYTGLPGLAELLRVTEPGGQMLVAFLENSDFTRAAVRLAVACGLFPLLMRDARFIELADLAQLNVREEDSATVIFMPPLFRASRALPRQGLVAFVLRKEEVQIRLSTRKKVSIQ
jgi:SAM-dependent methyltransferase